MKRNFVSVILFATVTAAFLSGCVPSQQTTEERSISADRLTKRLEANRRKVKNFLGTGTITIKTSELDTKSNFQVEIKKPDSVKISFYGPFGIDLAYALLTQKEFRFYDVINNTCYKGKMNSDAMKNVMKINIAFADLIDMLTGSVNLTDKLRSEPDLFEPRGDNYQLTYIDSSSAKVNSYLVNTSSLEISKFRTDDLKKKNLVDAQFSNFRKYDDTPIPFLINYNDLQNNQKIKIEYRSVEMNKEMGNLKLEIPNDAKIIEL